MNDYVGRLHHETRQAELRREADSHRRARSARPATSPSRDARVGLGRFRAAVLAILPTRRRQDIEIEPVESVAIRQVRL